MQWHDWLGEQLTTVRPLVVRSRSMVERELRAVALPNLRHARFRVRSSGHSTSDVARPLDGQFLLVPDADRWDPEGADDRAHLPPALPDGSTPVWLPACLKICDANALLAKRGLAFANLGSYDEQSVFGAITTGTHGTGMISGPLAEFVGAVDVTTVVRDSGNVATVQSFRVEAEPGITRDPSRLLESCGILVITNCRAFESIVVSMGCFGVVTGLVVGTVPAHWLRETRRTMAWRRLRDGVRANELQDPAKAARCTVELSSLPVRELGHADHGVLITERVERPVPASAAEPPRRDDARTRSARNQWERAGRDRHKAARTLASMASDHPRSASQCAWERLVGDASESGFTSRSDLVLRSSVGEYLAASSTEVAIPRERWLDAVDALIVKLRELHTHRDGFHNLSPIGIRFSRESRFLLAPQVGRDTCTIEVPMLLGATRDKGSKDTVIDVQHVLSSIEALLVEQFDGRPHWGQRFWSTAPVLERAYGVERWRTWNEERLRFDPWGLFRNAFSMRMGF